MVNGAASEIIYSFMDGGHLVKIWDRFLYISPQECKTMEHLLREGTKQAGGNKDIVKDVRNIINQY